MLTEKQAGRLDVPALVVLPTSLVFNWQAEAERFAPGLKVLNLHGSDRHARFEALDAIDLANGRVFERLVADPVTLCDALYAACKPQADAEGITDEAFGEAMAGDAIEAATGAVLDELISFCPSPRDRANLGRVLQATNRVLDKARDLTEKRIETLTSESELDKLVNRMVPEPLTSGSSSISAPEPLASIPRP